MKLDVDRPQPIQEIVASMASSRGRAPGPAVGDPRPVVGAGQLLFSFWAECECPGDCLRDHENE